MKKILVAEASEFRCLGPISEIPGSEISNSHPDRGGRMKPAGWCQGQARYRDLTRLKERGKGTRQKKGTAINQEKKG